MVISIHALHEESDSFERRLQVLNAIFQSTLSMRRATWTVPSSVFSVLFQSTLSMRRATQGAEGVEPRTAISIHALHEESDRSTVKSPTKLLISIHALHEESDLPWGEPEPYDGISIHALHEESDLPLRAVGVRVTISIHALHEESDRREHPKWVLSWYFNPRSP